MNGARGSVEATRGPHSRSPRGDMTPLRSDCSPPFMRGALGSRFLTCSQAAETKNNVMPKQKAFKLRVKTPIHMKGYVKKDKKTPTNHCLSTRREQDFRRSQSKCSDPPRPRWLGRSLSRDQPCRSGRLQPKAGLLARLASELGESGAEPPSLPAFPQREVSEAPGGAAAAGPVLTGLVSLGRIPASPSHCGCETKHKQERVRLFL